LSTNPQENFALHIDRETHLWLSGFLVLGTLPGLLGPLLILWQYHLQTDPRALGWLALVLNASCLVGIVAARIAVPGLTGIACVLSALAFVAVGFAAPPVPAAMRYAALASLGFPVGALSARIAIAAGPTLHAAPAQIANTCGAYFGIGALLATLLLDGAYSAAVPNAGPAVLALIPVAYVAVRWNNGVRR
jgi:hypothetical protein